LWLFFAVKELVQDKKVPGTRFKVRRYQLKSSFRVRKYQLKSSFKVIWSQEPRSRLEGTSLISNQVNELSKRFGTGFPRNTLAGLIEMYWLDFFKQHSGQTRKSTQFKIWDRGYHGYRVLSTIRVSCEVTTRFFYK
jgi:hypothetical protein